MWAVAFYWFQSMKNHPDSQLILHYACFLIIDFTHLEPMTREAFAEIDGVQVILQAAIQASPTLSRAGAESLGALRNLSVEPSVRPLIVRLGGLEQILDIAKRCTMPNERDYFIKDNGPQGIVHMITFLSEMAQGSEAKRLILENDGLTRVSALIECAPDDSNVRNAGAMFMNRMLSP